MNALQQYLKALREHGPRSQLVKAYRDRVDDAEEKRIVDGILRRGDDSARRVLKRLQWECDQLPQPLAGPR